MRLTKTLYTIHETEGELIGYDPFGRPKYSEPFIEFKVFKGEREPYSSNLAEKTYGIFVEVTDRLFCKPNPNIIADAKILYNEETYRVMKPPFEFEKHIEVLIKKEALANGSQN
ncbi:MAG: hypothetical protein LPK00_03135 [Bacillaceae bacterium]|nr:hypothetical protein [Bacillaceae bacterium]